MGYPCAVRSRGKRTAGKKAGNPPQGRLLKELRQLKTLRRPDLCEEFPAYISPLPPHFT
ncbi:MAG: hypothetical protein WKG07_03200 [Hymenobacter sp.]